MRRRRIVEAETLFRLPEIAADDVDEVVEIDLGVGIERIDVVHADHPRGHVVFVVPGALVFGDDIRLRLVVGAEIPGVHFRVFVADGRVGEEAQRLMRAHRPAHFFVDIGLDHLRAPVAVIAADEARDADVVKKTCEHDLFAVAALERMCCALQKMVERREAVVEEVDQRRLLRHFRQPRIGAHQKILVGIGGLEHRAVLHLDLAVGHSEQHGFGGDTRAELVHHLLFELVGLRRQRLRFCMFVHGAPAFCALTWATDSIASTIA